ncbi:MAG TPA: hypothetical protein VK154_07870 [Chitinophagales bacterium]|nr:hypothetical protein [Chitinophagales bacterium]
MREYKLRMVQKGKVVVAIVLPAVLILPLVYVTTKYPAMPAWLLISLIVAAMGAMIALVLWLIKRVAPKVLVRVSKEGLQVEFIIKGFLMPANFAINWNQLTNFWYDEYEGAWFMSFETNTRPAAFQLSPVSNNEGDVEIFAEALDDVIRRVDSFNKKAKSITSKTIYDSWWAKGLTVLVVADALAFPVVYWLNGGNLGEFPWGRYILMLAFAVPFVYKVWEKMRKV